MHIVIKFPTRSRPEKFKTVFSRYIELLSGDNKVTFIVSCDSDDETMNNQEMTDWIASQQKENVLVQLHYGDHKSKVEAVNSHLDHITGDVLLVASDDMIPAALNYDSIVAQGFNTIFPNYDGAIKFNDGLRNDSLMTLPCLGWNLYKAIGHVYHPDYTSLYCDNEQTRLCAMLGKLSVSDMCICKHDWVPSDHINADELHKRNESFYEKDYAVFLERSKNNYDIDRVKERLNELTEIST
jgi:hypothetical protein